MKRYLSKGVVCLIGGLAGVGKSTSAKYLFDKLASEFIINIFPFATGVKDTARSMGWDGKKDERGRTLLQKIGAIGRAYNEDVWVEKTFSSIYSYALPFDFVLIDDWRFPNEDLYSRKQSLYSTYTIHIEAPNRELLKGTPQYFDVSETSLNEYKFNYVVDNRGTFEELYIQLDDIVEEIITKNLYYVKE